MKKSEVLLHLGMYLYLIASVLSEVHFHRIMFTYSTGKPEVVALTFVDELQITHYDSISKRFNSSDGWVRKSMSESWKNYKDFCTSSYFKLENEVNSIFAELKEDVLVFQWISFIKCNGGTGICEGYERYALNGVDVMSLDMKKMIYINLTAEAAHITEKWNKDRAWINIVRHYYTTEFPAYMKKIAPYLQKTVPPQVFVWQKNPSSPVVCLATGFYPKAVNMTFQKNGEDVHENVNEAETLINVDGTFQKRGFLRIQAEEWKKNRYSCVVRHESMNESIVINVTEEMMPGTKPPFLWRSHIAFIPFIIFVIVSFILLGRWNSHQRGKTDLQTREHTMIQDRIEELVSKENDR